ncbi:MAG: trypsin-like serine protease [Myxococcales bacterium]|nr:trypsin-like serine protease [Myxococcales bacterium]
MKRLASPALLALSLLACADGPDAPGAPSLAAFEEKVVRGELTRERPEVGSISMGCTATLVAPEVGLTAAHCVDFGTRDQPGRYGTFTLEPAAGGQRQFVIERYRSYSSGDLGPADLALFRLATPVPADVARPAPLAATLPGNGAPLTVFGYGCTQRNDGTDWRKRKASFPMGTATNHLCPGDSGGPVFDDSTGAVLRVNSGYYLDGFGTDIFGDVARYHATLRAQVELWSSARSPSPARPTSRPTPTRPSAASTARPAGCGRAAPTAPPASAAARDTPPSASPAPPAARRPPGSTPPASTPPPPARAAPSTRPTTTGPAPPTAATCCAARRASLEISRCDGGCAPGAWQDPADCR